MPYGADIPSGWPQNRYARQPDHVPCLCNLSVASPGPHHPDVVAANGKLHLTVGGAEHHPSALLVKKTINRSSVPTFRWIVRQSVLLKRYIHGGVMRFRLAPDHILPIKRSAALHFTCATILRDHEQEKCTKRIADLTGKEAADARYERHHHGSDDPLADTLSKCSPTPRSIVTLSCARRKPCAPNLSVTSWFGSSGDELSWSPCDRPWTPSNEGQGADRPDALSVFPSRLNRRCPCSRQSHLRYHL